jgi:phage tail sheath protein FI
MSGQLLSSKVVVVEEEPRVRGIPAVPTSIAGAVGVTERGPIGEPVLCSSFEEFEARFGGFTADSDLALAAMGFFENGGTQLWVVRTVHYGDVQDPATQTALRGWAWLTAGAADPTPAEVLGAPVQRVFVQDGDTLVLSVDGGPPATATVVATQAELISAGVFPTAFAGGEVLDVRVMGMDQSVAFDAVDQSVEQVAARMNEQLQLVSVTVDAGQLRLRTDLGGTDIRLEVVGGDANAALAFPAGEVAGAGNVAMSAEVGLDEIAAIVAADVPGVVAEEVEGALRLRTVSTGAAASIQVDPTSTLDDQLGLDNDPHLGAEGGAANALRVEGKDPGAFANRLEVEVRPPTGGEARFFDLAVIEDGVYREVFANVTMTPGEVRHVEAVLNDTRSGSVLVRVIDQALPGSPALDIQTASLAGGDDGLVGLDDNDFIGSEVGKTGLRALDTVQDLSLLLVPGRATSATHNAMVSYCEQVREGLVFAVLDPPAAMSATDIIDYVTTTAALGNLSEHAAIYWPRVKVLNPSRSVFGSSDQLVVAPSGIIAGVCSRADGARPGGVYDPPAGIDKGRMFGVLGFETDEVLEERKRDLVYPKRINPLTTGPGLPRYIDGSRTLKGDGNFPYVAERRGVSFIERSLKQGLQFARHKNNTEGLRAQVRRTITAFLLTQMNNGAFRSREPDKAFFVDVSDTLNTPSVIFAGKLIARVGLATNKPAEFIILRISQDTLLRPTSDARGMTATSHRSRSHPTAIYR